MLTSSTVIGLIIALLAITVGALKLPLKESKSLASTPFLRHRSGIEFGLSLSEQSHDTPERPLSPIGAFGVMRTHRLCRAERCPRKAAALLALTGIAPIKPRKR
ncbi:hypothetical protein ACIP5Y_21345 [Nocardia sp. NPDC088792]|uniref:hypothetical protein n=1 Tax=Nocardia sp. NPDC088792 TaxID=3364332 RepID=UPI00381F2427